MSSSSQPTKIRAFLQRYFKFLFSICPGGNWHWRWDTMCMCCHNENGNLFNWKHWWNKNWWVINR